MVSENPYRNMPFLHRNWLTGLTSWQSSKPKGSPPGARATGGRLDKTNGEDHHPDSRPAKRPRLNDHAPAVEQKPVADFDRYLLSDHPRSHQHLLRIDVLKLVHKHALRTKFSTTVPVTDITNSKARCTIKISYDRTDLWGDKQRTILHCESRMAEINSFTHSLNAQTYPVSRINLKQPFIISREQLQILDRETFEIDWAKDYTITTELEWAGGNGAWPPINPASLMQMDVDTFTHKFAPFRQLVLCASFDGLKGSIARSPVQLRDHPDRSTSLTDYLLELDTAWTTTTTKTLAANKHLDQGMTIVALAGGGRVDGLSALFSSQTTMVGQELHSAPDAPMGSPVTAFTTWDGSNGVGGGRHDGAINGAVNDAIDRVVHEEDDLAEGELTPSRSLRARANNMVYNLKKLSDKAHGTERTYRRRQQPDGWSKPISEGEDCRIFYNLPAEQLAVEGFICCVCAARTQTMSQLRVHFLNHPYFVFDYQQRPGKNQNIVQITRVSDLPAPPLRPGAYQLGIATRPFDLDKYLSGDDSWVKSRLGPENDDEVELPLIRVPQKLTKRRVAKHVVVPNTKQPLFDAVSKVLLKPGSAYRSTPTDYSWLIQKHREVISDYSDLNRAEKEYIQEWDAFIIGRLISSDAHIAQAHAAFAVTKSSWLMAKPSRLQEFGRHTSTLLARNVIDEKHFEQVMAHLSDGRDQHSSKEPLALEAATSSPKKQAQRPKNGCNVCGRPALGPSLLVCSGQDCKARIFHDHCLPEGSQPDLDFHLDESAVRSWLCPSCAPNKV